jgi:hypothetical protein
MPRVPAPGLARRPFTLQRSAPMNYPIWEGPTGGPLIACVAIVHVFVSHFAVGGGLFLVLTERKARREGDERLLAYVRRFSRFFVLLSLVLGAITGVGIWFTIGLVNPQATASLITTFVWVWAIEWTFFAVEIAAAMVYYYGWDRLPARRHMAIGWVYWTAWLSLVASTASWPSCSRPAPGRRRGTSGTGGSTRRSCRRCSSGRVARWGCGHLRSPGGGLVARPGTQGETGPLCRLVLVLPMAIAIPLLLSWYFRAAEWGVSR